MRNTKTKFFVLFFLVVSFFKTSNVFSKEAVTPEEMYTQAMKMMDRGNHEKATILFEKIKTKYPLSQYANLSELRVADSFYKRNLYVEAIDSYQTFIKLHPKHADLDYVTYQIGKCAMKDAPGYAQQDQASTERALFILKDFEVKFPNSKYLKEAKDLIFKARERLANKLFSVGKFYYQRSRVQIGKSEHDSSCLASINRFQETVNQYPEQEKYVTKALYYSYSCQIETNDLESAEKTLNSMKALYPNSNYISKMSRVISKIDRSSIKKSNKIEQDNKSPSSLDSQNKAINSDNSTEKSSDNNSLEIKASSLDEKTE